MDTCTTAPDEKTGQVDTGEDDVSNLDSDHSAIQVAEAEGVSITSPNLANVCSVCGLETKDINSLSDHIINIHYQKSMSSPATDQKCFYPFYSYINVHSISIPK